MFPRPADVTRPALQCRRGPALLRPRDEHFHVLRAMDSPTDSYRQQSPEGLLGRTFPQADTSSPLQFFDLRAADTCEVQSPNEYARPAAARPPTPAPDAGDRTRPRHASRH